MTMTTLPRPDFNIYRDIPVIFEHAISAGRRGAAARVRRLPDKRQSVRVLMLALVVMVSVVSFTTASAQSDEAIDSATVRLQVALGSLVGQADPDASEAVIADVLENGADPLAPIEYDFVTAHEHSDSFSYLINLAEMAAAREEAGETAYLPADWRERAVRYHDLMSAAAEAPSEARFYLERITGLEGDQPDETASLAERMSGASMEMSRLMADATTDTDNELMEWQRYERDAYAADGAEIDW